MPRLSSFQAETFERTKKIAAALKKATKGKPPLTPRIIVALIGESDPDLHPTIAEIVELATDAGIDMATGGTLAKGADAGASASFSMAARAAKPMTDARREQILREMGCPPASQDARFSLEELGTLDRTQGEPPGHAAFLANMTPAQRKRYGELSRRAAPIAKRRNSATVDFILDCIEKSIAADEVQPQQ